MYIDEFQNVSYGQVITNLFIGLTRHVTGLPKDLRELGYEIRGIEYNFTFPMNGDLENVREVNPDIVIGSSKLSHSIILEIKGGANIEDDQCDRYLSLDSETLRDYGFLNEAELNTFDITYFCKNENLDRIRIGLSGKGCPLLVSSEEIIELDDRNPDFKVTETSDAFKPLNIDWGKVPLSFFPFDKGSRNSLVGDYIMSDVLEQMAQGSERIIVEESMLRIFVNWPTIGGQKKHELKDKAIEVLRLAERYDFKPYISRDGRKQEWIITQNPLSGVYDERLKIWKRMKKKASEFSQRLTSGELQTELDLFN